MTIAFETHTTSSSSGAAGSTSQSVTVNKPTGLTTGDILVAIVVSSEDDGTTRALSQDPTFAGFTKISERTDYSTGTTRRHWSYYKKISDGLSEPADYTFTVSYPVSGNANLVIVLSRFSGADTVAPIDTNSTFDGETTSTTLTFNGVTTTTANTMLVMCGGSRRNVTTTYNDGTKIADAGIAGTTASAGVTATMGYLAQAGAGASGNKSASIGATARENDGLIVALKEAAGGLSITSVTPSSFDDGRTGIVIAGSGFGASQGSSTLTIGGQAQTVTAWSDTSITFTSVRGSNSMGARSLTITRA